MHSIIQASISHSKHTFAVENPSSGEEIISVQEGRAEDVDTAVKAARKTSTSPAWRDHEAGERGKLLNRLADIMEEHAEELIAIEMLDTGKIYRQASTSDFPGAVATLRYYAGWADKVLGLTSFNIPKNSRTPKGSPWGFAVRSSHGSKCSLHCAKES